jgi:hypothetical protein
MYASIAFIALTGSVVVATPEALTWHTNYDHARQVALSESKPLAVFFGSGQGGYAQVSRDGQLAEAVQKTLGDSYVCMYVDTNTAAGKKLASAFAMSSTTGLVLSDRTGKVQAFYHEGDLSTTDLSRWLTRFADPNIEVRTTVVNDSSQTSMYPPNFGGPAGYVGGGMMGYAPYGQPWYGGGGCIGGNCGGGCAGGHCGGLRHR